MSTSVPVGVGSVIARNAVIKFLITAFAVFLLVKAINTIRRSAPVTPPPTPTEIYAAPGGPPHAGRFLFVNSRPQVSGAVTTCANHTLVNGLPGRAAAKDGKRGPWKKKESSKFASRKNGLGAARFEFEERSWYKIKQWGPRVLMPSDAASDTAAGRA